MRKQDYVASLLRENPATTLNLAGKLVKAQFGTQLAYNRLREAYVNAGGKIDTRRGPPIGSKRGPRTKKSRGAGKRSPEATRQKMEYVADLVRGNPGITMNECGKRVRDRFGAQLSFDKLKQAFTSAGGQVGRPGRRAKPRAKIDRRIGRRASDQAAARVQSVLKDMPQHVVVLHNDGGIDTSEFTSRDQAVEYARSQAQAGVPLSNIAYYLRQPLEISVGI